MPVVLFSILALAIPEMAVAQANQHSRSFENRSGQQVTCTTGQIGQRHTRGVAIVGRRSSTIDAAPTDALWRSSGCEAELNMTNQERWARVNADMQARFGGPHPGEPDKRFEDIMREMFPNRSAGTPPPAPAASEVWNPGRSGDAPMIGGAVYVARSGDSSTGISRRFDVSIEAVEQANGRSMRRSIQDGEQIVLPENSVDMGSDPYAMGRIMSVSAGSTAGR